MGGLQQYHGLVYQIVSSGSWVGDLETTGRGGHGNEKSEKYLQTEENLMDRWEGGALHRETKRLRVSAFRYLDT